MNELVLSPSLEVKAARPAVSTGGAPRGYFKLIRESHVAWLIFDTPGSPANVLNDATLRELDERIREVAADPSIRALIVKSAKEKVFVAGADLKAIRSLPADKVEGLVRLGQEVFGRLAALPMRKVAAIHGACVGGGFELALACDVRVTTDDDATRIGLPEVQLGLIPGWGGCTRLPRLLGLTKALDVILSGRLMKASHARKLGLVDHVVPREHLDAMAMKMASSAMGSKPSLLTTMLSHWPMRSLIMRHAEREVRRKTRGLYPAPLRALHVLAHGVGRSIDDSLRLEREALCDLAASEPTRHLIDVFLRKEAASKKPWPKGHALAIRDVAVIGAGVMGAGIAQWLASRGCDVTLTDVSPEAVGRGMARIRELVDDALKRRLISKREAREMMDRIRPTHERVPLHHCGLIIEAATEDQVLKKKIFVDLAKRCADDAILATNTSALSVAALAETVAHPERVIGLHFFNPVHRMPLIEVIVLPDTSDDVVATVHFFVQMIGKTPVVVKDSPGFVVNRVLVPYLMDAVRLVETGHDPVEIDEAMLDFGMPMGPVRLLDEIGLDVALHVAHTLGAQSDLLKSLVSAGSLGKKVGKGFYLHTGNRVRVNSEVHADAVTPPMMTRAEIQQCLTRRLSEEALAVHAEGVARSATDVDLAMVLGAGYAPFRGGPLAFVNKA